MASVHETSSSRIQAEGMEPGCVKPVFSFSVSLFLYLSFIRTSQPFQTNLNITSNIRYNRLETIEASYGSGVRFQNLKIF